MKIGILTFHNAINYGAVLQAYATQELLKSMGHSAEVIDYRNLAIEKYYDRLNFHLRMMPKRRFWRIPRYVMSTFYFYKKRLAFENFSKHYLQLSKDRYYQQSERIISFNGYDRILIGSDQLWNKKLTNGIDQVYWGNFGKDNACKVATWSICMNNIFNEDNDFIKSNIQNFDWLSVREINLQSYLKQITQKKIVLTLDPTLLIDSQIWKKLCLPLEKEKYICVYSVINIRESEMIAQRLSQLTGLKIIFMNPGIRGLRDRRYLKSAGPKEFLSYIKNATYVITSSFHGTVFSILFKKQFFCVVDSEKGNVRITSLLEQLNLTNRIITPQETFNEIPICEYKNVDKILESLRENSLSFITNVTNCDE